MAVAGAIFDDDNLLHVPEHDAKRIIVDNVDHADVASENVKDDVDGYAGEDVTREEAAAEELDEAEGRGGQELLEKNLRVEEEEEEVMERRREIFFREQMSRAAAAVAVANGHVESLLVRVESLEADLSKQMEEIEEERRGWEAWMTNEEARIATERTERRAQEGAFDRGVERLQRQEEAEFAKHQETTTERDRALADAAGARAAAGAAAAAADDDDSSRREEPVSYTHLTLPTILLV